MSKLSLVLCYFIVTPAIILLALVFSLFISYQSNPHQAASFAVIPQTNVYAALPATDSDMTIQTSISSSDARAEIVRQFLARHNSPLEPFADDVIEAADTYGINYSLVPAIAGQESGFCSVIPDNSYNCWGYGIYPGHVTRFTSYQQGIWQVTQTLATKYIGQGLRTPREIMSRWTPSSNGSWANGVEIFMSQLE